MENNNNTNSSEYFLRKIKYCTLYPNENGILDDYMDIIEPLFIMMIHPNYFNQDVIKFFDNYPEVVYNWFVNNEYDFFFYTFEREDMNDRNHAIVNKNQSFIDLCKKAFDMNLFKQGREKIVMDYINKAENYKPDILPIRSYEKFKYIHSYENEYNNNNNYDNNK